MVAWGKFALSDSLSAFQLWWWWDWHKSSLSLSWRCEIQFKLSSLCLQPISDDRDELVFDDVELHDVDRLLGKPELVKLIEQINYAQTCTHAHVTVRQTMTATNHNDQLGEIYPATLNELNCTFGVSFSRFHCCGHHGHGLWPSWFVAVMVLAPHVHINAVIITNSQEINWLQSV